jgi:hypothetical protein
MLVFLFAYFAFCTEKTSAKAPLKMPMLVEVRGQVDVTNARETRSVKAKKNMQLIERAEISTAANAEVKMRLSANLQINILANSSLILPGISWEDGHVPLVQLKKGQIRWIARSKDVLTRLNTELFDLQPADGDFLFEFDPVKAIAAVKVISGSLEFSAINAEQKVMLSKGQKVVFQGQLEDGLIAADILLQGRRIPRGQLGLVENMSQADQDQLVAEDKKRESLTKKAIESMRKAKLTAEKKGYICNAPLGQLNDCVWRKKAESCARLRCNANGLWADEIRLSDQANCLKKEVVAVCDY